MSDIAVVDYGMGNLRSVSKALEHVAPDKSVVVTSDPVQIAAATHVVFPGQGAMPDCIHELDARLNLSSVFVSAYNCCSSIVKKEIPQASAFFQVTLNVLHLKICMTQTAINLKYHTWAGIRFIKLAHILCGQA